LVSHKHRRESFDDFKLFKNVTKVDVSKISKKTPFKRDLTDEQKKLLNQFYLFLKGKKV
jgi:integrase/recombinase XerD